MSVAPRIPGKLNPQFDCQALYNFEGNFDDTSGLTPANLSPTGIWRHGRDYTGKKALLSSGVATSLASAGSIARLLILGDVTAQVVCMIPDVATDTGTNLFSFDGTGTTAPAENAAWKLSITNTARLLRPSFVWEHGAGVSALTLDTVFSLMPGMWNHIVGVREGTDARLYVNGMLVATDAGITQY